MNFGHKIAIFYGLFVILMLTLVTLCVKQKDISLVSNDYYKKEIAYQDEIDKLRNAGKLDVPVTINYAGETQQLRISFPDEQKGAAGKILFYRPSDAKKDFSMNLSLKDDNTQQIAVNHLLKGLWVVKLEWEKGGKGYMKEEKIIL